MGGIVPSKNGPYVYCHERELTNKFETTEDLMMLLDGGILTVNHTDRVVDIESGTSQILRSYQTNLEFPVSDQYQQLSEEERLEDFPYFMAFGFPTLVYKLGEDVLAWLDDDRFLTTELSAFPTELDANDSFSEETLKRNLFVSDMQGNKELIDSGNWEYMYLGSIVDAE